MCSTKIDWKKVVFLIAALLLVATEKSAQSQYKIGIIAPLTGSSAEWGVDVKNAVLFANEKFGDGKFQLIIEDDRCLARNAVAAAQKLLTIDHVDFGMVVCTESALTTAPLFEQNRVLMISPIATGASLSNAGDYIFRTWPSDAQAATLLYDFIKVRHTDFGLLTEQRGYSQEFKLAFLTNRHTDVPRVFVEDFLSGESDVSTQLLRLQKDGVTGLFINANSVGNFVNILRQIKALHWDIKLYGAYLPGSREFLNLAGSAAKGIVYVDSPSLENLSTEGRSLFDEYSKRFGVLGSADFVLPSTVESFRRIVSLSSIPGDHHQDLYRQTFQGIFGAYSFDENGDIVGVRHEIREITDTVAIPKRASAE